MSEEEEVRFGFGRIKNFARRVEQKWQTQVGIRSIAEEKVSPRMLPEFRVNLLVSFTL